MCEGRHKHVGCVRVVCRVQHVWFVCRAIMSELQAVLEFQVELFKFFNIDLFQRGSVTRHCCLVNTHYF